MKTIGIKLADGSFFPVLQEGQPDQKKLELTTAHNNQTRVMVDLYRSEEGSMDDAEYVDTLQIDNINEHPRGDASIAFNVTIDENNELSANIVDEETGIESKTTIELVNRTLEERMADEVSDYDIAETSVSEEEVDAEEEVAVEEESSVEEDSGAAAAVAAGAAAGAGLLAAAMILNEEEKTEAEEPAEEDFVVEESEEEPVVEEAVVEEVTEDLAAEDILIEEPASEGLPVDFDLEETNNIPDEEDEFDLPDFSNEAAVEETPSEETISDDSLMEEEPLVDLTLPEETPVEDTFTTDDLDLPDFTEENTEGITAAAEAAMWDEPVQDNSSLFDLPDFEEEQVPVTPVDTDMDWDFDDELTRAENSSSSDSSASNGLSFTGLYDKETELGESDYEDEGDNKKRKTSVVICIICAIICIIAVLLILFVIPSKLNVLKHGQKTEEPVAVETPIVEPVAEPEPEPEPEPVIETSAKEDEIVIIEEAEEVKPEPPAPPKEEPKPDIIYKIKWGDTLWDIADTYYKNPWRYKKIARYNGIKDPDYIVSGTRIKIPQE